MIVALVYGDYHLRDTEVVIPTYTVAKREYYATLYSHLRAEGSILLSTFPRPVGKPGGLLRATAAADPGRYTTRVSDPTKWAGDASNVASNIKVL